MNNFSMTILLKRIRQLCKIIQFQFLFSENHFVIVGGNGNNGQLSNVEALDQDQHLTCNIPNYPMALSSHSSTVTSSGILVCGGYSSGYRKDCFEYRSSSNSWTNMPSMTTERTDFDMIYQKGKVYAVGGSGGSRSKNSMDIFDSTTRAWTKQSMPFSVNSHCISQLSANQFILIAGNNDKVSKNVMKKKYFNPRISFFTFHYVKYFL